MSVFKNRDFAILFFGQLISSLGNNLYGVALPWYVLTLTGSRSDLALTGIFQALPGLAGLFIGVYIDRWRKKQTLISVDVIRMVISLALFVVVIYRPPLATLLVLVFLLQFVGTFFSPASSALIPKLVPPEEIPAASGTFQSGSAFSSLVGGIGGGAIMVVFGPALLFLTNSVSFLVSVTSLFFIRVKETVAKPDHTSLWKEWKQGTSTILQSPLIRRITIAALVTNFALSPFDIAMTAWIKGPLHGNSFDLGLIFGTFASGALIGGLALGGVAKRLHIKTILLSGLVMLGASMVPFGFIRNLYGDMTAVLIAGFAVGIMNGSLGALLMKSVPSNLQGRIFATLTALVTLASPLGMALFGWLMVYLKLNLLFVLIGVPIILSGLSFLLPIREGVSPLNTVTNTEAT